MWWRGIGALAGFALLAGCSTTPKAQTYLGSQEISPSAITAADVARQVQIVPRGDQVFFQAPSLQTTTPVSLDSLGKQLGMNLGMIDRIRYGYLFGVLDRRTGAMRHHVLFQSNFVEGHDRYVAVTLPDGTPLQFTLSRNQDPCVPNCFPVIEALIIDLPDTVLRADASTGLDLTISVDDGQVIRPQAVPAYVQGYLQAVDGWRARNG